MLVFYWYILQLQTCEEPLLNVTGDLSTILYRMCQLMEIQAIATKVDNGSDLNAVLEQNVLDTCQWVSAYYYANQCNQDLYYIHQLMSAFLPLSLTHSCTTILYS